RMPPCGGGGYDGGLTEPVGVGQSETLVANTTACFVALMLPGAGDELQGIKRGLLELVDVIAVNKADGDARAAAELAARQYAVALKSLVSREDVPAVLTSSALYNEGIAAIWQALVERYEKMKASGELHARRRLQVWRWLWSMVEDRLQQAVRTHPAVHAIKGDIEREVLAGHTAPEAAARRIVEAFGLKW